MNTAKVVCVGEALTVLVPTVPGPLEEAETFRRSVGGAELNVAIGLASLGVPAAVLTRVGDDGFGRNILREAARHGVDVSAVETDPVRSTGVYLKEVGSGSAHPSDLAAGASRMHYYRAGSAGSALDPALLERPGVRALLDGAALVHTTGITPALSDGALEFCRALVRAPRAGRLVSFDVNWRPALWTGREEEGVAIVTDLARRSDVVLLGATEAQVVFGTADPGELRALLPDPRILVVKNDGNAATAFDGDERVDVPALRVEVVEAIGAGDAFAAGFLAALVTDRGDDVVRRALEAAHRLAVIALSSDGDHVGATSTALAP
ncbi:sugar kinase [Frondihabitans sp. 762G35]|uniref:sugar kinase n=1 Tax=Frondihabitans sp. 762G35 TaxID=1446794 RepID=UPI001F39BE4B|nr:sugar kinase [Frondihabitans sp. 762G35]